jgi:uncharacterized membrane protein YccC
MFCFGFYLKRRYAVAVVFITLAVVLLTEAHGPVPLAFTIERLTTTLAGGVLALIAALWFWPVWERVRLRPILAKALQANRDLLRLIGERLAGGGTYDDVAIAAKRRAESENSAVFSSLQRMMGDPRNQQHGLKQVAAYANGNQRITRALTVIAVQLSSGSPLRSVAVESALAQLDQAFAQLSRHLELAPSGSPVGKVKLSLSPVALPPLLGPANETVSREHWILLQLARITTELRAMALATEPSMEPTDLAQAATSPQEQADRVAPA